MRMNCPSSGSSITADYSSANTDSPSITPTTTPQLPCMCNMTDCVCAIHEFMFPPTAILANDIGVVVLGVVFICFTIVTTVLLIVCLLIVGKKYKHRKNCPGEGVEYTAVAATALYSLLLFFTASIDHVYLKQNNTKNRFVLRHLHVQICC